MKSLITFKKINSKKKSGFVLLLTISIIAATVFLISLVINRVNSYVKMSSAWSDASKANMLAISGVEIAKNQLTNFVSDKKDTTDSSAPSKGSKIRVDKIGSDSDNKSFFDFIFNKLNNWQVFKLKENVDGIDGKISIYLSCEEGKININKLLKPEKEADKTGNLNNNSKFTSTGKNNGKDDSDILELRKLIDKKLGNAVGSSEKSLDLEKFEDIGEDFEGFDDLSEFLIKLGKFKAWKKDIFMLPGKQDLVIFSDIFTVFSDTDTDKDKVKVKVTPLLFSSSLQKVFEIKADKSKVDSGNYPSSQDNLNPDALKSSKIDWKSLWEPSVSSFYSKKYEELDQNFKELFSDEFAPKTFSVISYGEFGLSKRGLCVILKLEKRNLEEDIKDVSEKTRENKSFFRVDRVYYLA